MNNKDKYGEVFTPAFFVEQMIDDCKPYLHNIESIFEPGAGTGVFFDTFQNKNKYFKGNFRYVLNEINDEHLNELEKVCKNYPENTEIILNDCLLLDHDFQCDLVIGNFPFNCNTKKFVPSLAIKNKDNKNVTQSKSVTIWTKITHFCFERVLKPGGFFYAVIPCIWLKPDRHGIYELFTRDNLILLVKSFDCQTANTIFKYNCQTPMCYVLIQKRQSVGKYSYENYKQQFKLYDHVSETYLDFTLRPGKCIPTNCVRQFISHSLYLEERQISSCYEHVFKISTLSPKCLAGEVMRYPKGGLEDYTGMEGCDSKEKETTYKIITGSLFDKKTNKLTLNGFISSVPSLYYGKPKLILPHKRRAKFFKDYDGTYSCFGRDMYVFLCENEKQIDELYDFLNGNAIVNQMIATGFTIRMNFIEKYVFQYIPWIFDENFDYDSYYKSCC